MCKIKVLDSICGSGKTSAAINFINKSGEEDRFIYVTPFLEEVQRIIDNCKKKKFVQPSAFPTKKADLKRLILEGRNIVTTHSLFSNFDNEIIALVKSVNYTLIMDEVSDVVEKVKTTHGDIELLLSVTHADERGLLVWNDDRKEWKDSELYGEITSEFAKYYSLVDLQALFLYGTGDSAYCLMWSFPVEAFRGFKEAYILTYMFDSQIQRYYYDMFDVKYQYIGVQDRIEDGRKVYEFTDTPVKKITEYGKLIDICNNGKMNAIGASIGIGEPLSASWYMKNQNILPYLQKNIYNYFKNISKTPSPKNMWTVFKNEKKNLSGKGYAKSFVPCNSRATNNYRDRTTLAYMCNRYIDPYVKGFFVAHGVRVDEDGYALSELLQWMFRSALRNKEPIQIYIPSERMRNMLVEWCKTN